MVPSVKINIQCPNYTKKFTGQAKKIRGGVRIPCPLCKEQIAFDDNSQDERIRKALSAARNIRRQASSL